MEGIGGGTGGGSGYRLNDILNAIQNAVTAINTVNQTLTSLNQTLGKVFQSITNASSVAPAAGAVTYNSSQVSAFGLVTTSSGGNYRIALLPSS